MLRKTQAHTDALTHAHTHTQQQHTKAVEDLLSPPGVGISRADLFLYTHLRTQRRQQQQQQQQQQQHTHTQTGVCIPAQGHALADTQTKAWAVSDYLSPPRVETLPRLKTRAGMLQIAGRA